MPELAQRFGFDLANALACDLELLADLFERMVAGGLALHRVQSLKAVRDRTG